jgi:hypothetical protein
MHGVAISHFPVTAQSSKICAQNTGGQVRLAYPRKQ